MKAILVHLFNMFFGHVVQIVGDAIQVLDKNSGKLLIYVGKDHNGQYVDMGHLFGAKFALDMSPIPRDCRVYKLNELDKIVKDDAADEREKLRERYSKDGIVSSIASLSKGGEYEFDKKGNCIKAPVIEKIVAPESESSENINA